MSSPLPPLWHPLWHIAQLNVGRTVAPLDSPTLADFVAQLDEINALAEAAPGFVWRLQGASGNATDVQTARDPALNVNMSVWESAEQLFDFVYRTAHTKVMGRRQEWFEKMETYQVLFWIPAGTIPTLDDAMDRLEHLKEHGPSPHAFTFKERHPPPGERGGPTNMRPEPYCVPSRA